MLYRKHVSSCEMIFHISELHSIWSINLNRHSDDVFFNNQTFLLILRSNFSRIIYDNHFKRDESFSFVTYSYYRETKTPFISQEFFRSEKKEGMILVIGIVNPEEWIEKWSASHKVLRDDYFLSISNQNQTISFMQLSIMSSSLHTSHQLMRSFLKITNRIRLIKYVLSWKIASILPALPTETTSQPAPTPPYLLHPSHQGKELFLADGHGPKERSPDMNLAWRMDVILLLGRFTSVFNCFSPSKKMETKADNKRDKKTEHKNESKSDTGQMSNR